MELLIAVPIPLSAQEIVIYSDKRGHSSYTLNTCPDNVNLMCFYFSFFSCIIIGWNLVNIISMGNMPLRLANMHKFTQAPQRVQLFDICKL